MEGFFTDRSYNRRTVLLLLLGGVLVYLLVIALVSRVWVGLSSLALILGIVGLLVISLRQLDFKAARPMLMKEMRSRMRGTRMAYLLLTAAGAAVAVALLILVLGPYQQGGDALEMHEQLAELGQALFLGVMIVTAIVIALVTPAITSGVITLEYERQTFDFLLVTPLSEAGIIGGKLLAALSLAALLLLCVLPVTALAFLFGGVAWWQFLAAPLFILIVAYCFGAISLYCSARCRRIAVATTLAYVLCVGLLIAQLLLEMLNYSLDDALIAITGGLAAVILLALLILFILLGTSRLVKREWAQRYHLLKPIFGMLLAVLAVDLLLFLLVGGLDVNNYDAAYANPVVSLLVLLDTDSDFYSYYYSPDDDWSMVLVSLIGLLLIAQLAFRRARALVRRQRVQPPKPQGPRLRFRLAPW